MKIGKVIRIRTNVPGTTPVRNWPKPDHKPIRIPNWPVKKPAPVPGGKGKEQ